MLTGLLGRKIGMTQIFTEGGSAIPVTVVEAGPCTVTQMKTVARDGYEAIQIGYGTKKNATRPELGHLGHQLPTLAAQRRRQQELRAKTRQEARARGEAAVASETDAEQNLESEAEESQTQQTGTHNQQARARKRGRAGGGLGPFEVLREVEAQPGKEPVTVGQTIDVNIFSLGEQVDVVGTSKGKGFAGVMKRHGFHGGQRTHGQSDRMRAPGSIGAGTNPGRVLKGTRMGGHMGHVQKTIQRLEIVQADAARNLLVIKGSIPGPNGGIVLIRKQQVGV